MRFRIHPLKSLVNTLRNYRELILNRFANRGIEIPSLET
jgi:hypothetical protein